MKLTTTTAAVALGVSPKALDNLLSHSRGTVVPVGRRGRSRQLTYGAVERIAIAMLLNRDLSMPLGAALDVAESLIAGDGRCRIGSVGSLSFDLRDVRSSLGRAIATTLEEIPHPRRGRPRRSDDGRRGAFD
jgi:hypothetical protein